MNKAIVRVLSPVVPGAWYGDLVYMEAVLAKTLASKGYVAVIEKVKAEDTPAPA